MSHPQLPWLGARRQGPLDGTGLRSAMWHGDLSRLRPNQGSGELQRCNRMPTHLHVLGRAVLVAAAPRHTLTMVCLGAMRHQGCRSLAGTTCCQLGPQRAQHLPCWTFCKLSHRPTLWPAYCSTILTTEFFMTEKSSTGRCRGRGSSSVPGARRRPHAATGAATAGCISSPTIACRTAWMRAPLRGNPLPISAA